MISSGRPGPDGALIRPSAPFGMDTRKAHLDRPYRKAAPGTR